jgi:exopolyphosphatase/guanosine-5'-triphosphate,3'-diphosphate pyrophosphatase
MPPRPIAVVDIGTNSTRLLVAEVADGAVRELERRTTVTRLGEGVDASGRLSEAAMERVLDALAGYRELIDQHGADPVIALATSAVRDSANGDELSAAMRDRFSIEPRTISGDEEARLTFLGATSARSDGDEPTLVVDIGGGSTEFVIGRPGRDPDFHVSTQAGSVRQTERHLASDPPAPAELAALRDEVRRIIEDAVPADARANVRRGIAVAGTATSLAAIDQALDPYDPERVEGYQLERDSAERILDRLASIPVEERRSVAGLHPDRAPTIVAGAAILCEALRAFDLGRMEISERDILHGAALAARTTRKG